MSSEAVKLRLHIGCTHISVEGGPEEANKFPQPAAHIPGC